MIRKFKCINCNKQFDADEQGAVVCPYCHSDNVEPDSSRLLSWGRVTIFTVVVCALCIGGWWLFKACNGPSPILNGSVDNPTHEYTDTVPTSVEVSEPVFDGKNYSVNVEVKSPPAGVKFYYVRMNHFGEKKILQKCDDGHFKNIPYCEEDGSCYDFAIMDTESDTLLCTPMTVTGFIRQVSVSEKMTVQALQTLIDKRDPSLNGAGENDYLSPTYTLKFKGLPSNAVNVPSILAEVTEKLDMDAWQQVTVTNLEYDDMNRISVIYLNVKVSDY